LVGLGENKMTTSKFRGHNIEVLNGIWVYSDTKEPTALNYKSRSCKNCGKNYTEEGHDGCLGTLKGIMNACCGHGNTDDAYVQFLDGFVIDGEDAKIIQNILKKYR
jgi:hypothetical protein